MYGYYDPSIVALSVAVAIIASYTALDMAGRVSASDFDRKEIVDLAGCRRGVDGDRHLVDALHRHAVFPSADTGCL